jgi:hypothetical protein
LRHLPHKTHALQKEVSDNDDGEYINNNFCYPLCFFGKEVYYYINGNMAFQPEAGSRAKKYDNNDTEELEFLTPRKWPVDNVPHHYGAKGKKNQRGKHRTGDNQINV